VEISVGNPAAIARNNKEKYKDCHNPKRKEKSHLRKALPPVISDIRIRQ